ncbi:MAG: hypothetical protein U0P81_12910 [Holophagaceae bacterium]
MDPGLDPRDRILQLALEAFPHVSEQVGLARIGSLPGVGEHLDQGFPFVEQFPQPHPLRLWDPARFGAVGRRETGNDPRVDPVVLVPDSKGSSEGLDLHRVQNAHAETRPDFP